MIADLGLGSNLGDRLGHLQFAVDELAAAGCVVLAVSRVYETAPVGGPDGQGPYLNAVVRIGTDLDPWSLLALAHELEAGAGRVRDERWGPRTLDVDLLRCEGFVCADPALTVPHPRMHQRAFVLVPLADVDQSVSMDGVDTAGVDLRPDLALVLP